MRASSGGCGRDKDILCCCWGLVRYDSERKCLLAVVASGGCQWNKGQAAAAKEVDSVQLADCKSLVASMY